MTDAQADLEFEERQVMAFLAPLAGIAPATRASKAARPVPRFRRSAVALAVVGAFGAGAAVATTISNDPRPITVTERNGTKHPGISCPIPPGALQNGSRLKDPNGTFGHQPGEPCPTEIVPKKDQGPDQPRKGGGKHR